MKGSLRAFALAWFTAILLSASVAPAMAHTAQPNVPPTARTTRFAGQIAAIVGQPSSPIGFTLQIRDKTVDFVLLPKTNFVSRSAEAYVDGFSQYDFAVVTANKVNGVWTAARILYDVLPFGPIRDFIVTGRMVGMDRKGKNMLVKLMSGDTHWVRVNVNTKFEYNGDPVDAPLSLGKDAQIDVTVHRTSANVWMATVINLKPPAPAH